MIFEVILICSSLHHIYHHSKNQMKNFFTSIFLLFILTVSFNAKAQLPDLKLVQFSSGYSSPIEIENCGDLRLFIVQKGGQIFICDSKGQKNTTPFLDISDRVYTTGGEQGLLGLVFDPQFKNNGEFYVNYINQSQNTQISRFHVSSTNPDIADASSEQFILQIQQPFSNHNGGCLRFGPHDYLYIGMGDGGSGGDPNNNAQNPQSLLGKMLRINVHRGSPYAIPPTNPFVNSSVYKKEIWALGVRNPWRFSFDSQTNDLWIGDVGQSLWEEVDFQSADSAGDENYGWRCYEGKHPYNTDSCKSKSHYDLPIYEYEHVNGDCAITGGYVYRGTKYPNMFGKYIYCDYCSGMFKAIYKDGTKWVNRNLLDADDYSFVSFGVDKKQELYVANITTGIIYHIKDASQPVSTDVYAANKTTSTTSTIDIFPNPSNGKFIIQFLSKNESNCQLSIYDNMGRQVYTSTKPLVAGLNTWNIALPQLTKGNYYVHINNNETQLSKPLFIK